MSKKKASTEAREKRDLTKFCAFWSITLAGLVMFVGFIFSILLKCKVVIEWAGTLISICNICSMVLMVLAVALPAYSYVRGRKKAWKIVYWVALVLYIAGVVGIGVGI